VVRLTREALDPRLWSKDAIVLMAVISPPMVGSFIWATGQNAFLAYAILWVWGFLDVLILAWSKGASTVDMAKRLIMRGGWKLSDVPLQLLTGMSFVAMPILALWFLQRPTLQAPEMWAAIFLTAFIWFVVAPAETFLQAWLWPMSLPFGPIAAQVAFLFLHGERALDWRFATLAMFLGFVFWILTYLRYVRSTGKYARLFGPVAGWSAHATWDSLMIWVVFEWLQSLTPGG
jgi:hypothetical protein